MSEKKDAVWDKLLPAIVGFLGVVTGAVIVSCTSQATQNALLEQKEREVAVDQTRQELPLVREATLEFYDTAWSLMMDLPKEGSPAKPNEKPASEAQILEKRAEMLKNKTALMNEAVELRLQSMRMLIYSDAELWYASHLLCKEIEKAVAAYPAASPEAKVTDTYIVWMGIARDTISAYRNQALPDNWKRELISELPSIRKRADKTPSK